MNYKRTRCMKKRFGMTGTVLNSFKSYLCSRTQFVSINQSHSTKRDLLVGVPQGSVLGPLLYLLYTASISDVIASRQLNYHLYADDTQLYLAFKANDVNLAIDRVVSCVSEISSWMEQNDLKLIETGQDGHFVDPFAVSRGACT